MINITEAKVREYIQDIERLIVGDMAASAYDGARVTREMAINIDRIYGRFGIWDRLKEEIERLVSTDNEYLQIIDGAHKNDEKLEEAEEELRDLKWEIDDQITELEKINLSTTEGQDALEAQEIIDNCIAELKALT